MRPEGAPRTAPSRGITCVLAAPPPAHTGGIASSGERGFPHTCVIHLDQSDCEPSHAETWIFLIERPDGIIQSNGLEGDHQTV